ncbi:Arc family DNA-binding protein [Aureimonas ureilytica]|uniref:Arc family DNA-binding protein n=1 Tax=Aureimonas ureilytica TaxID=401562 RepID=UPI0009ECA82F|nr:Arc family DNA-binding protein [Aureimonas ureilytica]
MSREDLHFRLRIPAELKERIESSATANHRSITSEIVERLEWSFSSWPKVNLPPEIRTRAQLFTQNTRDDFERELNTYAKELAEATFSEHDWAMVAIAEGLDFFISTAPSEKQAYLRGEVKRVLKNIISQVPESNLTTHEVEDFFKQKSKNSGND